MLRTIGLAAAIAGGMVSAAYAFDDTALDAQMQALTAAIRLGERCGARLDVEGKAGVSSAECVAFTNEFQRLWRTREALNMQVEGLIAPYRDGQRPCDNGCATALVKLDQSKSMVIYYLDYVDFLHTM